MVLESTMLILDNSEYMRNGDYTPSRMEAQHDAANLIVGAKTQNNPENSVGVLTILNTELLVSPTDDMGKILSALHGIPVTSGSTRGGASGEGTDIAAAIQVAHLALKHRRNKNGGQRVVVFLGSPVSCDAKALAKIGRMLKKNNVAVDVVLMGEDSFGGSSNEEKMKELVQAANGAQDNCHLVTIPPGVMPSDVLVSSPIVHGGTGGDMDVSAAGGGGAPAAGGMDFAEFGGVDPNMDPELAMALRVSMEEERARQQRAAAATNENQASEDTVSEGAVLTASAMEVDHPSGSSSVPVENVAADSEEDLLLQQALAMSMNEHIGGLDTAQTMSSEAKSTDAVTSEAMDEDDAAMQMALQMSMQPDAEENQNVTPQQQFQDPAFVNQLLGSLPGVDPNNPAIKSALKTLNQQGTDDDNKDDEKDQSDSDTKRDENKN